MRLVYLCAGIVSVLLGLIGIALPVMPTVPFMLLAAFCFARGNPKWERWLVEHPRFGPPIVAWRTHGAIGRNAKIAATVAFTGSSIMGLLLLPDHWRFLPLGVAVICCSWIWSRPSA